MTTNAINHTPVERDVGQDEVVVEDGVLGDAVVPFNQLGKHKRGHGGICLLQRNALEVERAVCVLRTRPMGRIATIVVNVGNREQHERGKPQGGPVTW